jgi:hypothetical protein
MMRIIMNFNGSFKKFFQKGAMLLVTFFICFSGTALAADRIVIGEMFSNTS